MEKILNDFVLQVLDGAQDCTLATIRPDGYPQATTISFAHDGMLIYAGIGRHSQKADNIRRCNKVSLTVNLPYRDWREIRGLSMSAIAELLEAPGDTAQAAAALEQRFPAVAEWGGPDMASEVAFLRIRPQMVSVLDYSKGFGHTELVSA